MSLLGLFEESERGLYNSLNADVLGEDSGSDEDYTSYSYDSSKKKGKKKGGFGEDAEDEKKEEASYMFFDFRKGLKSWPENVELIGAKRAQELTEKALLIAEESARSKKSAKEEEEDKAGGKSKSKKDAKEGESGKTATTSVGWDSSAEGSSKKTEEKSGDFTIVPEDAVFETLKDGSTALILRNGYRIRLNLSNLLEGGDPKKEERRKKAEKAKKRREKYGSYYSSSYYSGTTAYGPSMGGKGKDDDDSDYEFEKWDNYSFKEYVNEYTITMDIKLLEDIPRDGLSLYQTGLVYLEQSKRSAKATAKKSDGECTANSNGGVGMFGTFGDTSKAKLEVGQWKRLVISVRCAEGGQKGEMRTWIDTEPGVVLKDEAIVANERFAIDPVSLYLFSSGQASMMPGNVAVRTVRVECAFMTDKEVKAARAKDKVLSMFNEERAAELAEQQKNLSLAALFPKPRPMWQAAAFVATFGDAFIENTAIEGASNLAWAFTVLNYVLQKIMSQSVILASLPHEARVALSDSLNVMQQSAAVFKLMLKMLQTPNESQLLSFLKKLKKVLSAIGVGESLLLPVFVEGNELIIIVQRTNERAFKFVVVQTNSKNLSFHSVSAIAEPPAISYRTCLVLNDIPKKNALDDVFWVAVYNLCIHQHPGDMDAFYDILLPFLTGKPLENSLVEAETAAVSAAAESEDAEASKGLFGSWRKPQMSNATYVRCILEALHFMLVSRGVTQLQAQLVCYIFMFCSFR
jgi:hypothetical protein